MRPDWTWADGRTFPPGEDAGDAAQIAHPGGLHRMRHDGCGGRPAKAELLTGVEDVSCRPMLRIVLRSG
jgi:hypothetical protein